LAAALVVVAGAVEAVGGTLAAVAAGTTRAFCRMA